MRAITHKEGYKINCYADSYLYTPSTNAVNKMVYLSMVGRKVDINHVIKEIRMNRSKPVLEIDSPEGGFGVEFANNNDPYRMWLSKTPGNKFHGIYALEEALFQVTALTGFYLIGDTEQECRDKFFGYMSRYSVPMYKSWGEAIWKIMRDEGWINELIGYNKVGYSVSYDSKELFEVFSGKIARKELTIPEEEWSKVTNEDRPDTETKQVRRDNSKTSLHVQTVHS